MAGARAGRVGGRLMRVVRGSPLGLACGLLYALLYGLALPPVGLWFLAFVAPVPLVWAGLCAPGRGIKRTAIWAGLGTTPLWLLTHIWIARQSELGLLPLVFLLAAWPAVFVGLLGLATRGGARKWSVLLLAPGLWLLLELLRGEVAFGGYAWYLAAHPLIESPGQMFAQPAAWIGTYVVGGAAVLVAALIVQAARHRCTRPAIVCAGVLVAWAALGSWRASLSAESEGTLAVAVAQSNVPQDNRRAWTPRLRVASWFELRDLTLAASEGEAELIVWPEGLFPGRTLGPVSLEAERASSAVWDLRPGEPDDAPDLTGLPEYVLTTVIADEFLAMSAQIDAALLVGSQGYDAYAWENDEGIIRSSWDAVYNSVFLVRRGIVEPERYDKIHLAPFGEVMPYISAWPWLERRLLAFGGRGMTFELSAGRSRRVFEVRAAGDAGGRTARVVSPVCFEVTVPGACRALVFDGGRRRAGLMVSLSQDGWFGDWTPGRRQYIQAARWRCVELATPLVRAANTGISGAYGPRGEVLSEAVTRLGGTGPIEGRDRIGGVLEARVPLATGVTLYARVGEWPAWVLGASSGVLVVLSARRGGRQGNVERRDKAKERAA
ncbi:MAG: apolipoprotein N-acyltransferase [Planctomycetota bacterium]